MEKAQVSKIVHMTFTVANKMQPAVIYVDEVERMFAAGGKKKGASAGGPALLKKDLCAHKDLLTNDHRILIIGNSRAPFDPNTETDDLCEFFNSSGNGKAIYCPYPDYATRMKLWSTSISSKGLDMGSLTFNPSFNLGALTHVSHGYTAGAIVEAVNDTLSTRRVQQIQEAKKAVESTEFLASISKCKCMYDDEYRDFLGFTEEITGEKARKAAIKAALEGMCGVLCCRGEEEVQSVSAGERGN